MTYARDPLDTDYGPHDTPTTPQGLRHLDMLPATRAAYIAWTDPGPHPDWHAKMVARVHLEMPLLARALDRLTLENT